MLSVKMEEDQSHMTERILNLTLEILYLLTGERFPPVKSGDQMTIAVPQPFSLKPERNHKEKIVEITKRITELLTGEVPIRCQDVTVYFSMEEWEYLEGHKDLYKDVMMEDREIVISPADEYDVLSSSEEYRVSVSDYDTSNNGINECSPEAKYSVENVPQRLRYADRSADSSNPRTDEFHSSSAHISPDNSKSSFHKLHAITLNILPHNGQKTPDPINVKEPSYTNSDTFLDKGAEKVPSSNEKKNVTSSSALAGQQKTKTLDRPYLCSECGKCFNTKSHLDFHKKIHSGVRPYLCTECGKCFICKSHLTRHVSRHTGVRPFSCPECAKSFIGKADLVSHLRYHTGERPFVCTECGQSFMQSGHLTKHLRIHTGDRPFSCSECGKCFSWKDTLIKHQRTHTGKKTYTCRTCGKMFPLRSMLITHQRTLTGEQPSNSECGNSVKTKSDSQEHQNIDTAQKTFPHSESEEVLVKKSDLIRQQEIHSSREPADPEKSASPKESPATHFKIHTVEKPFVCSECGKCYSQKGQLRTHQRIHTGELPFTCSECGKSFNEKRYLINHQSSHTGVRAFSCSECGKGFTWKESLMRHLKIHSGVRPHSCSKCGKSFTLKGDLLRHQRTHLDNVLPC